jgi:hypothetical protein
MTNDRSAAATSDVSAVEVPSPSASTGSSVTTLLGGIALFGAGMLVGRFWQKRNDNGYVAVSNE